MTTLELIKSHELEESLVLVMDDIPAKKVMAAWILLEDPVLLASRMTRPIKKADNLRSVLAEMWARCDIDFEHLSKIAGLPYQVVTEIFARLMAAQLVYPDCTLPLAATRLLKNDVTAYRLGQIPRGIKMPVGAKP